MSKLAVAIIGCALGLVLAPVASASPGDVSLMQSAGLHQLPVAQQQGSECDPNYEPCVPVDSDVDCASGSGNGPSYVDGPVSVVGEDIYELDRDGNGTGCES
ncbi:excalibur domain-containing protein [Mycolicibacterium sp. GCM10028919]|uniref:excalibur domain-containing protein n=1 Tax=Mycolicibacterium sp. GCM10028919 TaxID=3273401 RepID=UPI00360CB93E